MDLKNILKKDRAEMTTEEEKIFVEHWFNKFEKIGFKKEFNTPYNEHKDKNLEPFSVIGRVSSDEADIECLPQWKIRFSDEKIINAYPEEIIKVDISIQAKH